MNKSSVKLGPRRAQRSTPAGLGPYKATEVSVCRSCSHAIGRTDEPWENGWRCLEGCDWRGVEGRKRCTMMIGCVPTPGAFLV